LALGKIDVIDAEIYSSVPVQANINLNQTRFANGADISIPCEVDGYPTPEITWSKNGEKVESNTKISISGENILDNIKPSMAVGSRTCVRFYALFFRTKCIGNSECRR
jgi:hypothetical protein